MLCCSMKYLSSSVPILLDHGQERAAFWLVELFLWHISDTNQIYQLT
jgi:hypothetical protein